MSRRAPLGNARKIESPWPTSMAVISRMAGLACGCGVIFQTQVALVISRAIAAAAVPRAPTQIIIASRIADAETTIVAPPGVANADVGDAHPAEPMHGLRDGRERESGQRRVECLPARRKRNWSR